MDNGRPRERRVLPIKVTFEGQVHGCFARPIKVDSDMASARSGRPDAPDATRTFHFGQDKLVTFLANVTTSIPIRIPFDILARSWVIPAGAVIARPLGTPLARGRNGGEVCQISQAVDQIDVR